MPNRFQRFDNDAEVQLVFDCPGCEIPHSFRTQSNRPGQPFWAWNGDLDRATFSPSLLVQWDTGDPPQKRRCHSFVRDGRIQFLNDCTHKLRGQTVDVPEVK